MKIVQFQHTSGLYCVGGSSLPSLPRAEIRPVAGVSTPGRRVSGVSSIEAFAGAAFKAQYLRGTLPASPTGDDPP